MLGVLQAQQMIVYFWHKCDGRINYEKLPVSHLYVIK